MPAAAWSGSGCLVLAWTTATSTNPLLRLLRTEVVPRGAAPGAGARPGGGVRLPDPRPAQHRLPAQPGRPGRPPWAAPRAQGWRPAPRCRVARDGQDCWRGEALAGPGFHLLLGGPPGDGD